MDITVDKGQYVNKQTNVSKDYVVHTLRIGMLIVNSYISLFQIKDILQLIT